MQTAALIARKVGLQPLIDDDLVDRDYGPWTGQVKAEVVQQWGSVDAAPGVEPAAAVRARTQRALDSQIPFLGAQPVVVSPTTPSTPRCSRSWTHPGIS